MFRPFTRIIIGFERKQYLKGKGVYYATHLLTYLLTYLFTYLLTLWRRVLLEKLIGFHLVKKFHAFYEARRFTSARHLSLPWASSIQSIPPHPTSWRSNLIFSSHLRFYVIHYDYIIMYQNVEYFIILRFILKYDYSSCCLSIFSLKLV
jgi:hypothetical protein